MHFTCMFNTKKNSKYEYLRPKFLSMLELCIDKYAHLTWFKQQWVWARLVNLILWNQFKINSCPYYFQFYLYEIIVMLYLGGAFCMNGNLIV